MVAAGKGDETHAKKNLAMQRVVSGGGGSQRVRRSRREHELEEREATGNNTKIGQSRLQERVTLIAACLQTGKESLA